MITLNVYFEEYDPNYTEGTAILYENLITNEVWLVLSNRLLLSETKHVITKAENILKRRYENVITNINWDKVRKEKK